MSSLLSAGAAPFVFKGAGFCLEHREFPVSRVSPYASSSARMLRED
jgi:hypothetical protein